MSRAHAANPGAFNWRQVDVRCRELEEEIARQTLVADQAMAAERPTGFLPDFLTAISNEGFAPQMTADVRTGRKMDTSE